MASVVNLDSRWSFNLPKRKFILRTPSFSRSYSFILPSRSEPVSVLGVEIDTCLYFENFTIRIIVTKEESLKLSTASNLHLHFTPLKFLQSIKEVPSQVWQVRNEYNNTGKLEWCNNHCAKGSPPSNKYREGGSDSGNLQGVAVHENKIQDFAHQFKDCNSQ